MAWIVSLRMFSEKNVDKEKFDYLEEFDENVQERIFFVSSSHASNINHNDPNKTWCGKYTHEPCDLFANFFFLLPVSNSASKFCRIEQYDRAAE